MNALITLADRRGWRVRFYDEEETCIDVGGGARLKLRNTPGSADDAPNELSMAFEQDVPAKAAPYLANPDLLEEQFARTLLALLKRVAQASKQEVDV